MSSLVRVGTGETVGQIAYDALVGDSIALTTSVGQTTQWIVVGREVRAWPYPAPVGVLLFVAPTAAEGDPMDQMRVALATMLFSNPRATWEEIKHEVFTLAHRNGGAT